MQSAMDRHLEIVEKMPVHAVSPRGYVEVNRSDTGEITVKLRNGALRRLNRDELAAEISAALTAGLNEYSRKSHEVRQRLVGADFERETLGVVE